MNSIITTILISLFPILINAQVQTREDVENSYKLALEYFPDTEIIRHSISITIIAMPLYFGGDINMEIQPLKKEIYRFEDDKPDSKIKSATIKFISKDSKIIYKFSGEIENETRKNYSPTRLGTHCTMVEFPMVREKIKGEYFFVARTEIFNIE